MDANEVINTALAGGIELNARLTQLEQGYDASRAELHLEPDEPAPGRRHRAADQPPVPLDPDRRRARHRRRGVRACPTLDPGLAGDRSRAWTPGSSPGVLRPITFDPDAAEGRNDLVYVHLGHPIVQKAQRLLRSSLWSVDSPLNRVTAVVVDDLPESFVAAVTRMVLVGRGVAAARGGLPRRCPAARPARDGRGEGRGRARSGPRRPEPAPRRQTRVAELCDMWNVADAPLRARLEESMQSRASRRHQLVTGQLTQRRQSDTQRARHE